MKVKSDQARFSFLDLILLIQASIDRFTLNYCNKYPTDSLNISIESLHTNPDLNALPTYELTLERKAVLDAEIAFLVWDRNKATTTYNLAHFFWSR